ncbi:hypothetical protein BSLG_008912 [Batrachochytrium salamandrivorans]|nr:hypothetical protein BSLG_008912 [Batrachochytrium salamandrivorans]
MKTSLQPYRLRHNSSKKSPAKTTTKPTTTASKKDLKKQKSTQSLAGEASQTIVKDVAEELKKIQEELIIERRERNYFQLERDKVGHFWEITKSELHTSKADLLNKDRELEEQEEKHQVEIKDKRLLKLELKEFELSHEDIIKNLKQRHDQEITNMRNDFERQAKELHGKYEKKMKVIRDDLELKRKNEIHEIEERKNGQINALMKNHDKAFTEIKNYYNDITLNNLALINSLKEQVEDMKKKEERNEKQMTDITAENRRLSEPLQVALAEGDSLKRELAHYEKDKTSLQNSKARLKVLEEKYKQLTWEHEVLEQRFSQVQNERDELYENFVDRIISVQQKTGFKNLILEKKVDSLKENLEKKELQVNEIIKATNLDPTALESLTNRLEDVLNAKNRYIKDLQYDLAKVTKAHNDMIHVYEAKLTEFSIPVEELGFKPLMVSTKAVSKPAGLALSQ